eukprot:jgi/Ulvmu1/9694/UM055_0032.1
MTTEQSTYTGCVEAGVETFLVPDDHDRSSWRDLAEANIYYYNKSHGKIDDEPHTSSELPGVGRYIRVTSGEDLKLLEKEISSMASNGDSSVVVVDTTDWSIIPAENLVAAAQAGTGNGGLQLLMLASNAFDAVTLFGALEKGVDGVVMASDDVGQVQKVLSFLRVQEAENSAEPLQRATVTAVQQLPMGDRVCVDLCSRLSPGEGLLVGNFCRTLFLVHSECEESAYINSRPFRVNAGPVHAYVQASAERTAYLAELQAGASVLVVDQEGRQRQEVVGRCKVESRPLVMVSAATADSLEHSVILQNAETVKLVGPAASSEATAEGANQKQPWRTIPVTDMHAGDTVLVQRSDAGRHMGMSVQEKLSEL